MEEKMKIVLTGGGTAGHAMVNAILADMLKKHSGDKIYYIGSHRGAERELIERIEQVSYYPISTGKLRRYFSLENAKDFFRVCKGIIEAYRILKQEKVNLVFSGGGFVSLPVVLAARLLKIKILIRETDISIGLANRICMRFADKIFTTFPDTLQYLQSSFCKRIPCECSGLIVRAELLKENNVHKQIHCPPIVLVMGGSLGSNMINRIIWENIEQLSKEFQITHLCGKGQTNAAVKSCAYVQKEYATDMADLYAQADVVVTRCGSNAISEGLALGKRMVCIPISNRFSRGEQTDNAHYAQRHGCTVIVKEDDLCAKTLAEAIKEVLEKPLHSECLLSENILNENCRRLVHEMHAPRIE